MGKKILIFFVASLAVFGTMLFFRGVSQGNYNQNWRDNGNANYNEMNDNYNTQRQGATGGQEMMVVRYTDNGFSPDNIMIKNGQSVTFMNESSRNMWIASAPHPVHNDYPGFDQKMGVPAGQGYTFTFEKLGAWRYHNHLNPSDTGLVTVE